MDFVRSYFDTNEPLTSWTFFSSLFDWLHSKPVKKWGKKCSTSQRFIGTEVTSYKIHILVEVPNFRRTALVFRQTTVWKYVLVQRNHVLKPSLTTIRIYNIGPVKVSKPENSIFQVRSISVWVISQVLKSWVRKPSLAADHQKAITEK